MKIPEKAPKWFDIIQSNIQEFFKQENIQILNEFLNKIELRDEYVYWDTFKYLNVPNNVTLEQAWSYLKFLRQSKISKIPLICKKDQHFGYWTPDSILKSLSFIDKHASGEILVGDERVHKTERTMYLVNSLMEEAIASSQLEGAATTRKVAKEMLRSGRKPRNHAEQMIFNNYQTIMKIGELTKEPLSDEVILNLHRTMTVDTLEESDSCGRFRTEQDDPINVGDMEGHVLYVPPAPDKINSMMKILYEYANALEGDKFTHPIIKAINLHFYLAYIHPFNDGNGRTARALFYWYVLKQGYWMFEYLTISRIFLKTPTQYARAFLYTEIDDLDLTYFISFHLKVINLAIEELVKYIQRKQKEKREISLYFKKLPELNDRQRDLLRHALDHSDAQYTIHTHQTIHSITYESARRDLLYLEKKKLFNKIKKGKKFYYLPSKNILNQLKQMQ